MASLRTKYEPFARSAARAHGIDDELFVRQITQESGWADDVIDCRRASSAGAQGIAQIVARFHPSVNPCDPVAALEYAAKLMASHLAATNGDDALALARYNAGPGAVASGLAGHLAGWPYAETVRYVTSILGVSEAEARRRLTGGAAPMPVTYDPALPAIPQNDSWSCAPTSTRWALMALGRKPAESWIESQMKADDIVSEAQGLLDASGGPLAAWITQQYGEFGYTASNAPSVTFDLVAAEAGIYPILLGGRGWGHWSGVRGYDKGRQVLLLANPANGWGGVGQDMTRQQFAALGPFSMVRVQHPDLFTAPTAPTPPPSPADPRDAEIARLRAHIDDLNRKLDNERTKLGVLKTQYAPTLKDVAAAIATLEPGT